MKKYLHCLERDYITPNVHMINGRCRNFKILVNLRKDKKQIILNNFEYLCKLNNKIPFYIEML